MENKKPISHFVAGLILAAVIIIYSIALNFTGMDQNQGLRNVSMLILLIGLLIFVNLYGKAKNNFVTFGELFTYGFKITAIVTLIFIAFLLIYNIAFPEFKEKILETARAEMQKNDKMSESDVDNAIRITSKFLMIGLIGFTLFFFLIAGAIASLIGAAITTKKPLNPLDHLPE